MEISCRGVARKLLVWLILASTLLLSFLFIFSPQEQMSVFAATSTNYDVGTNPNVSIPSRAINVTAEVWGGGGGGGGAKYIYQFPSAYYVGGGGGGSGAYIKKNFGHFESGGTMTIAVGSGGVAGSDSPGDGGSGGSSSASFNGFTITAGGGTGGGAGVSGGSTYGSGGTTSNNGDSQVNGVAGEGGTTSTSNKSYGGAGGTAPFGGAGGARTGDGSTGNKAGNNGAAPGGGGSGARTGILVNSKEKGGIGGNGRVTVSYDIAPTPGLSASSIADTTTNLSKGIFSGGNQIKITGSGFNDGNVANGAMTITSVTFNGVAATNLVRNSNTQMTMNVPAYSPSNISSDTPVTVVINYKDQYGFSYSTTKTNFYTYTPAATAYAISCLDNQSSEWLNSASFYTNPSQTLQCEMTLNNPFNGSISLSDIISGTTTAFGGVFTSTDSRFNLTAQQFDFTYNSTLADTASRTLGFSYTPPSSNTIDSYFDGTNGPQIYWPKLKFTASPTNPSLELTGPSPTVGILAQQFWVTPQYSGYTCLGCESYYKISTHGAPYFGVVDFTNASNITNSDNPDGNKGAFRIDGASLTTIDFSQLAGADLIFSYIPRVTAITPNYIRIQPISSSPTITNGYSDIYVEESDVSITYGDGNSASLLRGDSGSYILTMPESWVGTVALSDPFADASGFAGGIFSDTSTGDNPPRHI